MFTIAPLIMNMSLGCVASKFHAERRIFSNCYK